MPASGPMPGSMPTSVPTMQPIKAYHNTSGRSATENPSSRLSIVSTASEPQQAAFERGFQRLAEQPVREQGEADAVNRGGHDAAALHHDQERKHQRRHGDQKAE